MRYQIGDFSTISRLTIKTLRYYHESGILTPSRVDEESGYRYYDEENLQQARIIQELKDLDFPLKDIKEILGQCSDDADMVALAAKRHDEITEKIARYGEIQKKLEAFIKQARQTEEGRANCPDAQIVTKMVPDMLVASIRFTGRYEDVGAAFRRLVRLCGRHASGSSLSLYYDNEYRDSDADIEACVPVRAAVEGAGVTCRTLPGGRVVSFIHQGPYEQIGDSYKVLIDHTIRDRLCVKGPSREVYLRGPGMIIPRSPKKYLTEIQMFPEERDNGPVLV